MAVTVSDACIGCGACVDACPVAALELIDDKANCNPDACSECGACVDTCPVEALSL
ncbi:MAG: 4Fe-4S binding protein [Planctomycetia bacterium]|nr:4Fe-4S binding protein [Planctomycetia bacterium]